MSYTKIANSETIVFINKNVLMQAYRQDIIKVLTFHNGVWHDAKLKYVLCARCKCTSILRQGSSLKRLQQNLNEKKSVIRRGDRTIAASVKLIDELYVLAIRVCVSQYVAEGHLAKQAETPLGMSFLVIKIITMLCKC